MVLSPIAFEQIESPGKDNVIWKKGKMKRRDSVTISRAIIE
jgi:hypothetical protein